MKRAKAENALTPLGEQLGADLEAMMKANIFVRLWCWKGSVSTDMEMKTMTGILRTPRP